MFSRDGEIYLLARRNVSPDGAFDHDAPFRLWRAIRNQLAYVTTAKRCALWRFDRSKQSIGFVLDLPSRGDTCFPAVIESENGSLLAVYDYSSPIEGADLPWSVGQRQQTNIYRHLLHFAPRTPL